MRRSKSFFAALSFIGLVPFTSVNKNSPTTSLSHFERRASRQVQPSDRRDAVATIVIGFTWGGWVFGTTFEAKSAQRVNEALVRGYALPGSTSPNPAIADAC